MCSQPSLWAAASIQATGTGEDMVRRLENYTGLLAGLQNLAVTMAGRYEEATEDIRALVASTLDEATQQDCAFVAGASQALANWTEKYQLAMSQGENQSLHDQLAHWDQVQQAGVTLSQKITSLTTDYKPGMTSSEIFQALLPDCFHRIHAWTEAHIPRTTCHPSHLALPVHHSQSSQADTVCHLHLYVQLQYRDLRDGHGPGRGPGLHHSKHLPGTAISLGGHMSDHLRYHL